MNIFKKIYFSSQNKFLDKMEALEDWLREYKDVITFLVVIINLITLGIFFYQLIYVVSLVEINGKLMRPKHGFMNMVHAFIYMAPQYIGRLVFNPYTEYFVVFFLKLKVLPVFVLNFLYIYIYYKWYIFVLRSQNLKNVFWILLFIIWLIIYLNLVLYVSDTYSDLIETYFKDDLKFRQYSILPFSGIWIMIYFIWVYDWDEAKRKEDEDKKRRDKYGKF